MTREIEQVWEILDGAIGVARIWKPSVWISEFVEEWVTHSFDSRQPLSRGVFQESRDEVDSFLCSLPENLK
jgi:hypothetical protein